MPHSPKPWKTVRGKGKHKQAIFIKSGEVWVAKVYGHEGQPSTENAYLISIAPNLADVLTKLVESFDGVCPENIEFELWQRAVAGVACLKVGVS